MKSKPRLACFFRHWLVHIPEVITAPREAGDTMWAYLPGHHDCKAVAGCFCLTFFKFFFGYGHGNLAQVVSITYHLYGGRQSVRMPEGFRGIMNQTISTTRETTIRQEGICLPDLYQQSLMIVTASQAYQDRIGQQNEQRLHRHQRF